MAKGERKKERRQQACQTLLEDFSEISPINIQLYAQIQI